MTAFRLLVLFLCGGLLPDGVVLGVVVFHKAWRVCNDSFCGGVGFLVRPDAAHGILDNVEHGLLPGGVTVCPLGVLWSAPVLHCLVVGGLFFYFGLHVVAFFSGGCSLAWTV